MRRGCVGKERRERGGGGVGTERHQLVWSRDTSVPPPAADIFTPHCTHTATQPRCHTYPRYTPGGSRWW